MVQARFGQTWTQVPVSPTPPRGKLRNRWLYLLGNPGCQVRFSLAAVTVYIWFGRSRPFSILLLGKNMPRAYYAFFISTDYTLIPRVRVTFLRSYVLLEHITVSTGLSEKSVAQNLNPPTTSNNSGAA